MRYACILGCFGSRAGESRGFGVLGGVYGHLYRHLLKGKIRELFLGSRDRLL